MDSSNPERREGDPVQLAFGPEILALLRVNEELVVPVLQSKEGLFDPVEASLGLVKLPDHLLRLGVGSLEGNLGLLSIPEVIHRRGSELALRLFLHRVRVCWEPTPSFLAVSRRCLAASNSMRCLLTESLRSDLWLSQSMELLLVFVVDLGGVVAIRGVIELFLAVREQKSLPWLPPLPSARS